MERGRSTRVGGVPATGRQGKLNFGPKSADMPLRAFLKTLAGGPDFVYDGRQQ
jgi:hypothetical protein